MTNGIPANGRAKDDVLTQLETFRANDVPWREGKAFGYVFDARHEALDAGKRAYLAFMSENGLDPTSFPSLLRLENEVVRMCATHVHGGAEVVGNFTSGGTESILLAMKSARDWAKKHRPELYADGRRPEVLAPITAHAAFHKAAAYLELEMRTFDVDADTCRASAATARAALTDRTLVLVGSAPSYAYGVIDDIAGLAALAVEKNLWMHVDACMGGVVLPFMEKNGEEVAPFDFRVPGVWSLSMDLHKYGYCPKGASVVLYRDKSLRKHQIYACSEWAGYTIVNATVQSTKSGGPLAGAWATMQCMGEDSYLRITREVRDATQRFVEGIAAIPGLRVISRPDMTLIAFTSDDVHVFHLPDLMKKRGWYIQPTLGTKQKSAAPLREHVHLSVTAANVPHVDRFLADLRACVDEARAIPKDTTAEEVAFMASHIDPAQLDDAAFEKLLSFAGMTGAGVPESTAGINLILQALDPALRKAILIHYLNDLFQ
ncbi:MAG: aspartate aminotransferase family protein [Deltaproteobacteria bacterium]|nr:aspartate aminotransferase family protein [Deltaproteobacteria bacterium]